MYSGLQFNAIVYEGFLPAAPLITGTGGPTSNVQDIEETRGRLGCGEPTVFITARCATGMTCVLDSITDLKWDRRLDDISEANVTVNLGGDSKSTCCECLSEVEPWCHELHIWRDGEEVWVGPVIEITYSYEEVKIRAQDSLAWTTVRIPPIDINFTSIATDLTDIAEFILATAFALDTVTCEMDNLHLTPTGTLGFRFWEAFTGTAWEMLVDLADTGVDFTTLGRTIVITGDEASYTPLILLTDDHIMGEIEVKKDGTLQGNRWYVHFEGDQGTPASGEAVSFFCYGPIERMRDGDGLQDGISAGQAADTYVASSAIAPRSLEVPSGSKLSPDTPWTINQMVPGARVDVAVTKICFPLTRSFRLTLVETEYSDKNGESVNVTLSPIDDPSLVAP